MTNTIPMEPGFYGVRINGLPDSVARVELIAGYPFVFHSGNKYGPDDFLSIYPTATFGPKLELFPEIPANIEEVIDFLRDAVDFAYGKGLHEIGYDPVELIVNYIKRGEG